MADDMDLGARICATSRRRGVCRACCPGTLIWSIRWHCATSATRIWPKKSPRPFSLFCRARRGRWPKDHFARLALPHRALRQRPGLDHAKTPPKPRTGGIHAIRFERTPNPWPGPKLRPCWTRRWRSSARRIMTPLCSAFSTEKVLRTWARRWAPAKTRPKAGRPRAGEIAAILCQTWNCFDHHYYCGSDFLQFHPNRAGGAGKIRDGRGHGRGLDGWQFNFNPR